MKRKKASFISSSMESAKVVYRKVNLNPRKRIVYGQKIWAFYVNGRFDECNAEIQFPFYKMQTDNAVLRKREKREFIKNLKSFLN